MSAAGRRPGHADTRGEIVEAARRIFAAKGYDGASLRAVAREAGVDPALVHHYFDGKSSLFVASMAIPFDPRDVKQRSAPGLAGSSTVEAFLTMWDRAEGTASSFASCAAAMANSAAVADAIREFVRERVWSLVPTLEDAGDGEDAGAGDGAGGVRLALMAAQLMGLAFARYVLRVPPLSTASPAEIARWTGPLVPEDVADEA